MCLACNAPGSFWDEFFQTAAYLTNLTAATSNLRRTPYELWFGRIPSLSHLCEIGCRAFSLEHPSLSKIYPRSNPCILIGYAPHSKAYRLWDPTSNRLFNSFHVTFTEHLEAVSSPFQPCTILNAKSASSPPSWDICGPNLPTTNTTSLSPFSCLDDNVSSFLPSNNADHPSTLVPNLTTTPSIPAIEQRNTTQNHNTTATSQNTVTPSNNTVTPANNNVTPTNNTITPTTDTVPPTSNNAPQSNDNNDLNEHSSHHNTYDNPLSPTGHPRLTITIPPRPPLRRSARLHALTHPEHANLADHTSAFLTQYSTICDTHDLFPTDIALDGASLSIDDIFSALSDGSMEPTPTDLDDEPTWEQAMASGERKYWIAGGRDELKSLQDLQVFVLVHRSG